MKVTLKEKEENLRKLNEKEQNEGAFNEIFDTMNQFESTGKIKAIDYLGKKTDRK